jgi:predicted AAA+ superfamily ATPase
MKSVSESLAGRADIVELETLSLAEIRAALPQTAVETAIVRGGFPETVEATSAQSLTLAWSPGVCASDEGS